MLNVMPDPGQDSSTFPMAHCPACAKFVLTYIALDDDLREGRRCAHCDGALDEGRLKWVSATELESEGYYVGTPQARAGGCGSGGCGSCGVRKA